MYETTYRCKWLCDGAKSIGEMAERMEAEAAYLREMERGGVRLATVPVEDDHAQLEASEPLVATKYGLEEDMYGLEEE